MELTPTGRLIAWLELSLLVIGIFLSNTLVILSATLLFLYFLFEGVSVHRDANLVKDSIKLESRPSMTETTVGRPFKVETLVTNSSHSRFSIARFIHNLPLQIDEESHRPPTLTIRSYGKQHIETLLKANVPGRFEITTSTTLLESRAHLFSQTVTSPDKVIIIARPLVSGPLDPIDAAVLADLAVDHVRLGNGTDLAGIRPFNFHDESHSIDWKATARTGKLMTRESYLEREPTIILMMDASSSFNTREGSSILERLLDETENLLTAIRPASPMGLIMYDRREVVVNIEARQGFNNRERILNTLLERAKNISASTSLEPRAIRPYTDFAREIMALTRKPAFSSKTKEYRERLSTFAGFTLPFYERAKSKYLERLRGQGVFRAFEMICALPEPVLVIVISDGETNLDGLAEGMKRARWLNHQVVLAILASPEASRTETLLNLADQGVGILRCPPEELSRAINAEIHKLSHSRPISFQAAL